MKTTIAKIASLATVAAGETIQTPYVFCALTHDGSVVSHQMTEAATVAGTNRAFAYEEKQVLAFAYEVCAVYNDRSVRLDSGFGSHAPKWIGSVFDIAISELLPQEQHEECTIDTSRTCDDVLKDVMDAHEPEDESSLLSLEEEPSLLSLEDCLACDFDCGFAFPHAPESFPEGSAYVQFDEYHGACLDAESLEKECYKGTIQCCGYC